MMSSAAHSAVNSTVACLLSCKGHERSTQIAARDGVNIPRWVALKMQGYRDDAASIRPFGIDAA
jgi:methylenetetrahydrofolate reductase (NADPH)